MEKGRLRKKYEGGFKKERCTLPFNVECRRKQDCCWVEVNLATLTYMGYYQILNIGVSLYIIYSTLYILFLFFICSVFIVYLNF